MKRVIIGDFVEYNDDSNKLGNFHYANCFSQDGYEVLWVSNAFNELVLFKDKQDYLFKRSISSPQRHKLAENIYGFAPYSLRLYGNYLFSRDPGIVLNNEKYIRPGIKNTLEEICFDKVDVLWISNPKHYWLTNVVKYNWLVYRIPDDFSRFSEYPKSVAHIEEKLIKKADVVFITASSLQSKVIKYGKWPRLLSNGVCFEHFNGKKRNRPMEYKTAAKKIVYVGAVKYWFDVELVKKLACEIGADIFIIGKPQTDLSLISQLQNVHILGARPYSDIPAYLQHADAAIIPFVKSELTDAVSPIKLYEYCSAGVPVICSDMNEVKKLNAPVYVAKNHEDFILGTRRYLREGCNKNAIVDFGRKNSWLGKYKFAKEIIFDSIKTSKNQAI